MMKLPTNAPSQAPDTTEDDNDQRERKHVGIKPRIG